MKKKFLSIFITIFVTCMCVFALTACGGQDGKDGVDGVTPTIEISRDGYWVINGVKTEHKAIGKDGEKGDKGDTGEHGKSAYQIWLDNGNNGSEQDFLKWLQSPQSEPTITESLQFQKIAGKEEYSVKGIGTISSLEVVIPETYNNLPVTEIADAAFYNPFGLRFGASISSITIPSSVTSIGDYAFYYCDSLTSVVIGDSVTSIGEQAFSGCISLTSINYNGTIAKWNSISKGSDWAYEVDATVYCTDGNIII